MIYSLNSNEPNIRETNTPKNNSDTIAIVEREITDTEIIEYIKNLQEVVRSLQSYLE